MPKLSSAAPTGASSAPEGPPVCPRCHGAGYVRLDLPVTHPDFGRAQPCACKQRDLLQRRIESLRSISNLGPLTKCTFESFRTDLPHLTREQRDSLRRAWNAMKTFADTTPGWVLLVGGYGSGKTHLAAAVANERIRRGHMALFLVVPAFLSRLRSLVAANDTSGDQLFEAALSTPLLVLDDLGTQSSSPWVDEKLFLIFNERYNARLPTVITTNYDIGKLDPRLRSRLLDTSLCHRILLRAPDYRIGEADPADPPVRRGPG